MPKSVLTRGRRWTARLAVLAMVASMMAIALPASAVVQDTSSSCPDSIPSAGFTDLGGLDATTVQAIDCLVFYGISQGTSASTFSPNLPVPRWQMALFLTRQAEVHGVTLPDGSSQGFTDIGGFDAATQTAINQLAQLGITQGTSATTFDPLGLVTRWQMALFLTRLVDAAGVTLPDGSPQGYTDIGGQSSEAQTAINQVTQLGIAQGTSATTFVPDADTLRWQMALFLTRTLAADNVTPPADTTTDMPELVSVSEDSYDSSADELVLVYMFDEELDFVDETSFFRVYEADGTQHEADDTDVDGDEVTATFEDIDGDEYDALTTATVAADAVEDTDGDQNPEGRAPYKDTTITTSDGALDGLNLDDVDHEDRSVSTDESIFLFTYDDDGVDLGDVAGVDGFGIVLDSWDEGGVGDDIIECNAIADDDVVGDPTWGDVDVDDDQLLIECDASITSSEWARAFDSSAANGGVTDVPQAVDAQNTDAPDLVSVAQVGTRRVEFTFDEQVEFPDGGGCDDSDDCAGAEVRFHIYDEDGNVIWANITGPDGRAIVTNSNRVVRVEFDADDIDGIFGDLDDDLNGDLEGGFVDWAGYWGWDTAAVQERASSNVENAPDSVRVGGGVEADFDAGVTSAPDLVSVGDVEVSSTDLSGDADEWEVIFTFDEDINEEGGALCEADFFRIYAEDGSWVEGTDCDADDDEVTVTFDDSDVEDGILGGVAYAAVQADDNNQVNSEGVGSTEFAG